jgi:hypothetical protein
MEGEKIPKEVFSGKFYNTRPMGKPRTSREDFVRTDTSQILFNTRIEEEARTQKGL